jgi:hypothetical protein
MSPHAHSRDPTWVSKPLIITSLKPFMLVVCIRVAAMQYGGGGSGCIQILVVVAVVVHGSLRV